MLPPKILLLYQIRSSIKISTSIVIKKIQNEAKEKMQMIRKNKDYRTKLEYSDQKKIALRLFFSNNSLLKTYINDFQ